MSQLDRQPDIVMSAANANYLMSAAVVCTCWPSHWEFYSVIYYSSSLLVAGYSSHQLQANCIYGIHTTLLCRTVSEWLGTYRSLGQCIDAALYCGLMRLVRFPVAFVSWQPVGLYQWVNRCKPCAAALNAFGFTALLYVNVAIRERASLCSARKVGAIKQSSILEVRSVCVSGQNFLGSKNFRCPYLKNSPEISHCFYQTWIGIRSLPINGRGRSIHRKRVKNSKWPMAGHIVLPSCHLGDTACCYTACRLQYTLSRFD